MAGPVHNPFSSRKKAFAFENQSAAGTAATIDSTDACDVSSVNVTPSTRTTQDPRYTGTIHRPGDILLGALHDITFEWLIHGPASGTIPAANAFVPGRILQAWGFTENLFSTAIAAEAYTAGDNTSLTLGTSATGTAGLYKGLALNIDTLAAAPGGLAMISGYTASKVATLARNRTISATGNYSIPAQLAYTLAAAEPANPASITVWEGDNGGSGHRQNFIDCRPTAARIELVTSSLEGGGDGYCKISGTFRGTLDSEADEAPPVVSISTAIPPFLNGQQDIANVQLGGSSVTIDLGLRSGFPPNPNQTAGSDPGLIVETKRTVSYTLNKVRRSVVDWNALAEAQGSHPSQFIWGLASGNYMGVMIDAQRFDYPSTQEGSDFITTQGSAWIDGVDKAIALTFPIWA